MPSFSNRKTPDALRYAIEKLMLDTTEPLDPLVSLKVTNLTLEIVELAYQMGMQDSQPYSVDSGKLSSAF